jgi:LysM repeat protein
MKRSFCILMITLLAAGCAVNSTPTPIASVPTQAPTWTPQATYTPNPTYTPFPTLTYTPPTTTPTPTFTPAPTATPTPVTYMVKPGDMLTLIARQFNVPLESLVATNNIQNINIIEVGTLLVIPVTPTVELSATVAITVTPQPIVARPAPPQPPKPAPSNFVYPAPRIQYPANGATFKYSANSKNGGVESIAFSWIPVGRLLGAEDGQPCSWQGQPNGTTGRLVDRYQIEFDPPLYDSKYQRSFAVFHNDHGTTREFNLLEFKPDTTYTWRVTVGRWCVLINYDNQDPKHNVLLQFASPYSESRTFRYTP